MTPPRKAAWISQRRSRFPQRLLHDDELAMVHGGSDDAARDSGIYTEVISINFSGPSAGGVWRTGGW